jgi:hypothetical protein
MFEKTAVVKEGELKKAAQRVKEFSDKLLTGEIFQSPRGHLILRAPFAKPLLKYLLKRRLKREEASHA